MSEEGQQGSVLGPGCKATGQMFMDGDATIMGQFDGTIRVGGVVDLTGSSQVSGTILAGSVRLAGRVDADVAAESGVELLPGSALIGRVYTSNLSVADGASFEGEVVVGANAMKAAAELIRQVESGQPGAGASRDPDEADEADLQVQTSPASLDRVLRSRAERTSSRAAAG